jgi:DNA-directed RNA polymerase specialized sigma24 family protein
MPQRALRPEAGSPNRTRFSRPDLVTRPVVNAALLRLGGIVRAGERCNVRYYERCIQNTVNSHGMDMEMSRSPGTATIPVVTYADAGLEILWQRAFLRCRAVGASVEDAHDCAQDAITELFAHPDVEHPKAWVATVAYHRYVDLCRKRGREHCVGLVPVPTAGAADLPGPEEQAVGRAHAYWLVGVMKRWPASTRAVCSAVGAGMSRLEIVNRLGLTDRAVESHLTRARRSLRGLSLLAVTSAFAVMLGRAIRRIAPAGKPVTTAALLVPSVVVMLMLGGGEPARDTRAGAMAPQPAEPRQHPAQPSPGTSYPPLGTASDQAPNGSSPPTTGIGLPGLDAPDLPDLPIELPPIQLPPMDLPALPPLPLPTQLPPVLPATPPLPTDPGQLIPPETLPGLIDVEAQLPSLLPG